MICESRSDELMALADEFVEDPGCVMMVVGGDDDGLVLFAIWHDDLVGEVAAGLYRHPDIDVVRVLAVPQGAAFWP